MQTAEIVRRLRKPAFIVVNQAPVVPQRRRAPPAVKKALEALLLMRLPVIPILRAPGPATSRPSNRAARSRRSTPCTEASREMAELWDFIETFLFGRNQARAAE